MNYFNKNIFFVCYGLIYIAIFQNLVTKCNAKSKNTKCKSEDFKCASGSCISPYLICDGIKHCSDGSDETKDACYKIYCPWYMFRCQYGGCIKISSICNGIAECADGSDEWPLNSCKIPSYAPIKVTTQQTTSRTTPTKVYTPFNPIGSSIPPVTPPSEIPTTKPTTKTYTPFNPYPTPSKSPIEVPTSTEAIIPPGWCQLPPKTPDQDYIINDCSSQPSGQFCNLQPGQYIDQFSVLTFECNQNHYSPVQDVTTSFCLDGKWTPPVVPCQECGVTNVPGSINDNYIPWLVSIYDSLKNFNVCWGTLISPFTVVTAAHCVFDESTNTKKDTSNIYILVGKHLTGGSEDDETQQYRVASITLLDDSFRGAATNYKANLAILEIDSRMIYSNNVKQVCVDWKNNFNFSPKDGTQGLVPAWTINRQLAMGELHPQQYPFVSNNNCRNTVSPSARSLLTDDKFCVPLDRGTRIDDGNGGNGFFLYSPNKRNYHIFGVVSSHFVDSSNTPVLIITNINNYRDKIKTTVDEIEGRRKSEQFIDVRFPSNQSTKKKSK